MADMAALLAVNNFGDTESGGLAGPMGLFIIVVLVIVTILLIRNMNKRIKRLPSEFPDQTNSMDRERSGAAEPVDRDEHPVG